MDARAVATTGHGAMTTGAAVALRGHAARRIYTVVVFIVLASLDNVAIGLVPPLFSPIAQSLHVGESAVSFATGGTYLVSAVAAVAWAYVGDRTDRKPLLMLGTLIWATGTLGTALAPNFATYVVAQVVGATGLGAVASVGFSVVSDLISPRRRGLVMSFWGLSQGVGSLVGFLLGGLLGNVDWRRPFYVLTVIGLAATFAYVFTYNIRRGESEPALTAVFAAGEEYEFRINRADIPRILHRRTNVWLTLQGLTAQVVFGSLVLLPRLFQAKAEAVGFSQSTAIKIGSVYATIFTLGAAFSIVGGLVGDRLQRRTPRGRAMVAAVGILAGIPFYVVLFFVPLRLDIARDASAGSVVEAVLSSVFTQPTMAASFVAALIALTLTSANSPNWFALITEVEPTRTSRNRVQPGKPRQWRGARGRRGAGRGGRADTGAAARLPAQLRRRPGRVPGLLHPDRDYVLARLAYLAQGHRGRPRHAGAARVERQFMIQMARLWREAKLAQPRYSSRSQAGRDHAQDSTGADDRVVPVLSLAERSARSPGVQGHDLVDHQCGPSGLVRGPEAHAGVAVEILVERDQVPPALVLLEQLVPTVYRTAPVGIEQEQADQTAREVVRDLASECFSPDPVGYSTWRSSPKNS